ncbi:hypothetical protein [Staphylococcus gallinarum]|uniref:hypothetical protein n=1 Tax=Staphylococcus gallinarum TaxID=1293 RepID=UPI0030BE28AE
MNDFKKLLLWLKANNFKYITKIDENLNIEFVYIDDFDCYFYNDEHCSTDLLNLNDIVKFNDDTNFFYNDIYEIEENKKTKLETKYKIFDIIIESGNEILYTLQNIENKAICGVMVNDWELEKVG